MIDSLKRKRLLIAGLLVPLVALGAFFAGALAHQKCAFPFCRQYFPPLSALLPFIEREPNEHAEKSGFGAVAQRTGDVPVTSTRRLDSNLYPLQLDIMSSKRFGNGGGAIAPHLDGLLLAHRLGGLYFVTPPDEIHQLPHVIPFDAASFDELGTMANERVAGFTDHFFGFQLLGVRDIFLEQDEETLTLFASFDRWDPENKCHTLMVSMLTLPQNGLFSENATGTWERVFETFPCLSIQRKRKGGKPVASHQAGGRIDRFAEGKIIFTVGDYEFDGWNGEDLVSDEATAYGKTFVVDYRTNQFEVFTKGHRNPQGVLTAQTKDIWLTEHGPKGGDELNLLTKGTDYGWPKVTYGTQYGRYVWPFSERSGNHDGFARPFFSWVPSVGISQLTEIKESMFDLWRGDLIVSSLGAGTLFRVRVRGGRIIVIESIKIGERVRDIIELNDGTLAMKFDHNKIGFLRPVRSDP